MQEEVTQKTIALVIKTAKLNASVLKAAMKMYLNHRKQKAQKTHGKTSVKKLVGEGAGVSSIEVTDGNIKSFERVAKKYNVDFAVKKDKTSDPPKYVVFFKGRDADVVAQAFKEFVYGNEKKKGRVSIREKLQKFKDAVTQDKNRERSREKNKDRGQSL
ncbi:MAG: PcfB family protein [Lachnospiraceae bacterium]|nr:PcfB family protein [Muribaculum sp.]MCM1410853.1 PcfB family protein [Lachnospiraceae bacterium]